MRNTLVVGCALLFCWAGLVQGGGGTKEDYEKLADKLVKAFDDLTEVLATVKDKDSAAAAKPKIQAVAARLKEIQTTGEKLGKPDATEKGDLEKKYKEQMEAATKRFITEVLRVSKVDGGPEVLQELQPAKKDQKDPPPPDKDDK